MSSFLGLIKLLGLNISEDLRVVDLGTNLLGHFSCHLVGDFSIIHSHNENGFWCLIPIDIGMKIV